MTSPGLAALAQEREAITFCPPRFDVVDEGRYRLTVPGAVVFELDYIRREAAQLKGELLVRSELPGAQTFDGLLSVSDLNLSSARTRQAHAKYLAERARTDGLDFAGLLEEFAQRVLAAERQGQPAVILSEIPRPAPDEALEVDGLPLLARHPMIVFGDGGTAKSMLALYLAGRLAQRGKNVGFFDWELAAEDHRDRLERLFPERMPVILYARCSRPLVYEADRLRRFVRDHQLDFAIFDSVAFACDGPPEAAEVAGRYFQTLRQFGPLGSLHVAHVSKALEGADQRPFGSAFWHNGARATWNVKIAETSPDEATLSIALHHRKSNLSGKRASIGFELSFEAERTHVRRIDPGDVPDLAAGLTVRQRMAKALRGGALTAGALAEEIDADPETVRRTVRRYRREFVVLDGGRLSLLETMR
ncbi:MAG: AAA family ATPase [Thermoanaerobaculia bacterium]|nr:MAG: AAA family ATPase [Thermoanaerobaculia bacterium]